MASYHIDTPDGRSAVPVRGAAVGKWEHNASTGTQTMRVTATGRVVRQPFKGGTFLYRAEQWGDYSLEYPKKGPWEKTLAGAKKTMPQGPQL